MVGYYSQGHRRFGAQFLFQSGSVKNRLCNRPERISVKYTGYPLHNCCNPFEAHPGIYPFSLKGLIFSFFIAIELNKDKVPDFHKPVTITTDTAVRLSAPEGFSAVYVNF